MYSSVIKLRYKNGKIASRICVKLKILPSKNTISITLKVTFLISVGVQKQNVGLRFSDFECILAL